VTDRTQTLPTYEGAGTTKRILTPLTARPNDVKLWKISWPDYVMPYWGDRYDSAVVTAETEAEARAVHPDGYPGWRSITWAATPDLVVAEEIGTTGLPAGKVVCASFNAA